MNSQKLSLCGQWKLAVMPHKESIDCCSSKEIYDRNIEILPATVPGNLELDLRAANKVDDLFFGTNPDKIRRYTERLHCYYFRDFEIDEIKANAVLCFEGLDCYADVFINGQKVGSFDNMLIKEYCNISHTLKTGKNEILVHIKPAVIEALKYDYTYTVNSGRTAYEQLYVRKPAHMYGWDILPRYVSAGIWRPVDIIFEAEEEIVDFYLNTTYVGKNFATVEFNYTTKCDIYGDIKLKLEGRCKDSIIEEEIPIIFPIGRVNLKVENPVLWWPRGYGEPNQYEFKLSLIRDGIVIDSVEFLQGIRTVKLDYTETIEEDGSGDFQFYVNNTKIFIKGSNWVAADPFHSRDKQRIPDMIKLAEEINCNMLRCWGGSVYEDDLFYDLCDKAGILIWQDFCMACAKYPQDNDFAERIRTEAIQVVKRLRSHACIALWSGDNECDSRWKYWESVSLDPGKNILTREILPWVVTQYDPARTYLPSSPFVSPTVNSMPLGKGWHFKPEEHFYIWRGYYKDSDRAKRRMKFVSEFGSMGAISPESLKKFISPEKLWPYDENNDEWILHSTSPVPELKENMFRLNVFFEQLLTMFKYEPDSLKDFAMKSQITQSEHLKYYIEMFRSRKWDKTGVLWWNLIDGWPQFSDAVADYYFDKKLSFYTVKSCQQDICLMLTDANEQGLHNLVLVNDTLKNVNIRYTLRDMDNNEIIASGSACAKENSNTIVQLLPSVAKTRFVLLEWEGDAKGKNHYLDIKEDKEKMTLDQYLGWLNKSGLYEDWVEKTAKW